MSNIILKFSESVDKDTGLKLHTTKTGHFIKTTTSLNSNQLDLNLRYIISNYANLCFVFIKTAFSN